MPGSSLGILRAAPAPSSPLPASSPLAAAAPSSPVSASSPPAAPSSPDASSVARGLTTPSKPYIPKDDPSTPAVVISEAALSEAKRKADRARIAQTIPAQTRSAASASPNPMLAPMPMAAPAAPVSAAGAALDVYPAQRSRAPWILLLGGLTVTAVAAGAFVMLGSDAKSSASLPAVPAASPPAPLAASDAPGATPEVASPAPDRAAPDDSARVAEPVAAASPPPLVVERKRKPLPRKATPTAAAAPTARKSTTTRPATEPGGSTKAARGVIVRETPF